MPGAHPQPSHHTPPAHLVSWLAAALLLIIIFGTVYTAVQQAQRSAANSPQIQLAEDTAAALGRGQTPQQILTGNLDIAHSLAPFILIYDHDGKVLAHTGTLGKQAPQVPIGVLKAADGVDLHSVTWQPQHGIRLATVVVQTGRYYVVSARSLREVEKNEDLTLRIIALGTLASLLVLAGAFALTHKAYLASTFSK
jgi:hypothetical protein